MTWDQEREEEDGAVQSGEGDASTRREQPGQRPRGHGEVAVLPRASALGFGKIT